MLTTSVIFAQKDIRITAKDSIVKSSWIFGVGYNAVDDSGDVFDKLFSFKNEWNLLPYPSRFSIGRYFKAGIGIEAVGSYNKYKEGKIIDGRVNTIESNYLGLDLRITYDLNKIIGETGWFDPYLGIGVGYTEANNMGRGTYNVAVGFRTWFSDKWGLDFNSSGKWAMNIGNGITNHLQHSAGVVYQFGIEKGLSKKGKQKQNLIAAIEKENKRKADSIAQVNRLREEALIAERLAKEKSEAEELAALKKAELDAKNKKRKLIDSKIKELGHVYFGLNSSILTKNSKTILGGLVNIFEETPSLKLKITSHTDSRGASKYNDWLSERRVNKTKEYLVSLGVDPYKLSTESFGETRLLNDCDDKTYCSEDKHKINRRSEFIVESF